MKCFSNMRKHLGPGVDGWAISLKYMMSIVALMGFAISGLYWWVNAHVPLPTHSKKNKEKTNMTTMESREFKVLGVLSIYQGSSHVGCRIRY
uniref:ADP,ATP carrier protein 2, chloroplastic-like n=1 Tax=Erigeron canadensis TaxID=72917 RepID=UPI001CB8A555|nr:ADP,ATP carrier protein 2, chloroplastic-like [Erigeron canadensis]